MSQRIVAKTVEWNAALRTWSFTFGEDVTLYAGDVIVIRHANMPLIEFTVPTLDGVTVEIDRQHQEE